MESNEMKLNWDAIVYVAEGIVFHIQNGGWINDDWPNHIIGANALNVEELDAARLSADYRCWTEMGMSVSMASKKNIQAEIDE
jgi:hypothetical protein